MMQPPPTATATSRNSNNRATTANYHKIEQYTLKPFIEANCNICIDLKDMFRQTGYDEFDGINQKQQQQQQQMPFKNTQNDGNVDMDNEQNQDWYQLALFDTKFDLKNEINLIDDRETIIINVDKPRFYLQPGAIDNALLFYLNYKSTYDFWLNKRQQFANIFVDQQQYNIIRNAVSNN